MSGCHARRALNVCSRGVGAAALPISETWRSVLYLQSCYRHMIRSCMLQPKYLQPCRGCCYVVNMSWWRWKSASKSRSRCQAVGGQLRPHLPIHPKVGRRQEKLAASSKRFHLSKWRCRRSRFRYGVPSAILKGLMLAEKRNWQIVIGMCEMAMSV